MRRKKTSKKSVLKDLGDGLILRRSTRKDAKALVAYNTEVLGRNDERLGAWVRDLMTRPHPTFDAGDFTIVEDTETGKIVSSLNLIPHTWSYAGIKFRVGRPELVSTHPDYRKRGLIRAQFEVIHEWSSQRGEKMTAITGIPYFYRQFGYEMAVDLGVGRAGDKSQVPGLSKGQREPYRVRPAREADLPFIAKLYKQANGRYLLSDVRDTAFWRYELKGRSRKSNCYRETRIIETLKGARVGLLVHAPGLSGDAMAAGTYELTPGLSWLAVTPSVLRYLGKTGEAFAKRDKREFRKFMLMLGKDHPVYGVIPERLPQTRGGYVWYVRVPDLPDFLRHISPVLEQRLAGSVLVGHTGEIKISFYRSGLRMVFRKGRLKKVESWTPAPGDGGQAGFPNLTFLQLLFGYRTLDELDGTFPDCWARGDGIRALLNALFPKQASQVWPVG